LWRAAERLRGHVEPAEYKHAVLGLIFLRFVTDSEVASPHLSVPDVARWASLRTRERPAGERDPGATLAAAVLALERANPSLAGAFPFDARRLDGARLAALIEAIDAIPLGAADSRDVLGRVYEYFLARFASAEGRSGGEYYTPPSVVALLVEMVRPLSGTLYDPCCGSAGLFVQSDRLRAGHAKGGGKLSFVGQESSLRAFQIARMNLALRGIRADLGGRPADSFLDDRHPALKADFVLANPPFNARAWGFETLADDARWRFGTPPRNGANYALVQHIFSHLKPQGIAAFVLANGSLSSDQGGEGALRRRMIESDVLECIVALPPQLFYGTQIPACIWVVSPEKTRGGATALAGQTLFVDARSRGRAVDRVHAELTADDVATIADTYRRWRDHPVFQAVPGFARAASIDDIRSHHYALVPGRYVGFARDEGDGEDSHHASLDAEIDAVRRRLGDVQAASNRLRSALETMKRG
jgi:type I restriction enzyme M protein